MARRAAAARQAARPQGRAVALGGLGSCHQDHLVRLGGSPARTGRQVRAGVTGRAPDGPEGSGSCPAAGCVLPSPGTLGADAGLGRHPKVACGWNLAAMCASIRAPPVWESQTVEWSRPAAGPRLAGRLSGRSPMADPPAAPPGEAAMSGQDALLATKLHVPRPQPGFVPRPRLVQALSQGLARGRVLICAPAGFGK